MESKRIALLQYRRAHTREDASNARTRPSTIHMLPFFCILFFRGFSCKTHTARADFRSLHPRPPLASVGHWCVLPAVNRKLSSVPSPASKSFLRLWPYTRRFDRIFRLSWRKGSNKNAIKHEKVRIFDYLIFLPKYSVACVNRVRNESSGKTFIRAF